VTTRGCRRAGAEARLRGSAQLVGVRAGPRRARGGDTVLTDPTGLGVEAPLVVPVHRASRATRCLAGPSGTRPLGLEEPQLRRGGAAGPGLGLVLGAPLAHVRSITRGCDIHSVGPAT
jgi:hypothetical protein